MSSKAIFSSESSHVKTLPATIVITKFNLKILAIFYLSKSLVFALSAFPNLYITIATADNTWDLSATDGASSAAFVYAI